MEKMANVNGYHTVPNHIFPEYLSQLLQLYRYDTVCCSLCYGVCRDYCGPTSLDYTPDSYRALKRVHER